MDKKWEYTIMTEKHLGEMLIGMGEIQDSDELWWNDKDNNKITKALEELGESGWELTHISQSNDNDWEKNKYYFKREVKYK